MMEYLTTWGVIKAAGLSSYLLLFVSVCLGTFAHSKWIVPRKRALILTTHQWTGWFGLMFGILHGTVLTIDSYKPFHVAEILVPFLTNDMRVATGLGILTLYMLLAVQISSDLLKRIGKKVWRTVHYLPFPAYLLSLLHGILAGSDSSSIAARMMYAITGGIFIIVIVLRMRLRPKTLQT
ncbi:ferric reductase-like transmembrane domain-containing protein [Paenibacillus sp. KQZ6P-2]|uniref:Ferric reductase-like transmembrane domain-containing protein n=1 Tax=Paenibacillus mangrovi TaxID=2931978 RepID=A0A9X2B257_9BACL|nr:ferric reductase-like transmembrane domain-containing protein [Paenibacillus mangrovi]MCJ8011580.1 ferric reductase-like transmembrane domain-containing protein [Paenibacillus mangrovi]